MDGVKSKEDQSSKTWTEIVQERFWIHRWDSNFDGRKKERFLLLSTIASDRAAWKRLTLVAGAASLSSNGENY